MRVEPLTPARWDDFVDLFTRPGPRGGGGPGAGSGCWCMWWRDRRDADTNKAAMQSLVQRRLKPGLLAYDDDGQVVGWISIAPRVRYPQLIRSRTYAPVDDEEGPVWAIVCFYVHARSRRRKFGAALLDNAISFAFSQGAAVIEAYPATIASRSDYMGNVAGYSKRGFVPVREVGTRTLMRLPRPGETHVQRCG